MKAAPQFGAHSIFFINTKIVPYYYCLRYIHNAKFGQIFLNSYVENYSLGVTKLFLLKTFLARH